VYYPLVRHALLSLAVILTPVFAGAQSAVVDEGTFMVTRNGAPLGRESFRLVRSAAPAGQMFRATGQSAFGDHRATTSLSTDSAGVPISYESELTYRGQVTQQLRGGGRPGRFSVLVRTKSGESTREYVLNNGALLIDEDVFHHHVFVPMAVAGGHANVVVIQPRSALQERFALQDRGAETVEVAGRGISARRYSLHPSAEGAPREIWVDERGRLLKVSIPARGLVALRDDPPR
jgi:hypothetical protein